MNYLRLFPWLKWLKRLFVTLHFFLIGSILIASTALYIAFRPDSLEIVNTYFLEPFGIRYTHAQGSLQGGFALHNLQTDTMEAKTLAIQYNLVEMLKGNHTVDSIKIDGLKLHLDDFISDGDSVWPFPTFNIRAVDITNLQLISAYPVELDIHAKNGTYNGESIHFSVFDSTFKSRYAGGALHGNIRNSVFVGVGELYPSKQPLEPIIGTHTDLPDRLRLDIAELSAEKVSIKTAISKLVSKQNPQLSAQRITLNLSYRFENTYADVASTYRLIHDTDHIDMTQQVRYHTDGEIDTRFEGAIATSMILPSKTLKGELDINKNHLSGFLSLGDEYLKFKSDDYSLFTWDFHAQHSDLSFIPDLPKQLSQSATRIDASGNYLVNDSILSGFIDAKHNHGRLQGSFSLGKEHREFQGGIDLLPDAPTWREWEHKPPRHLNLALANDVNRSSLDISAEDLTLKATLESDKIIGTGEYLGVTFRSTASLKERTIDIDSYIPSVFATLSKIKPINLYKNEFYDAQLHAKTHIRISDTLDIESEITLPWYAAVIDSQNAYGGTDNRFSLRYRDGNISIDSYRIDILNHPIETQRVSNLHLSQSGGVIIDALWLYDTLKLTGTIDSAANARLRLYSDRFAYNGPEGKAHASADLMYESQGEDQKLSGSFTIHDASITNLPLQQFKVMDSDIIIIQDVRPPSDKRLEMNIQITSREPIRFKTKEFDLRFIPDFTLWKEPTTPMQILGMVTIPSGTATTTGKDFTIKHSEIYFGGDLPLNPYLDFTVLHEVDYKKIHIYVTHTLESPIFLFNSDPLMSQNDIMSYLLFGASSGDNSGAFSGNMRADSTNFMLGAGLKGIINGVTKIQIDTMNILTTPDGGMGFEVGARLNKDLRVIYKNNTVSSVLLQYNVNRWLRLDADIHELGQGINAIYIKDFRDFLPHKTKTK